MNPLRDGGVALCLLISAMFGQSRPPDERPKQYLLGPGDQIIVRIAGAQEYGDLRHAISANGNVTLPLIGRVGAAGLTVEQLEQNLSELYTKYYHDPGISVTVSEYRSQQVSVIGAVSSPGVHTLRGQKRLIELISAAGGMRNDASYQIQITRQVEQGRIPLGSARDDSTGRFSVAKVNLKKIIDGSQPSDNVLIESGDVISVPRADMVYVMGQVSRVGGYVVEDRGELTVLQALALAGGLTRTAAGSKARIFRKATGGTERIELPVNLNAIAANKIKDIPLEPEDILFVPDHYGKKIAIRSLESMITIGTALAVYH